MQNQEETKKKQGKLKGKTQEKRTARRAARRQLRLRGKRARDNPQISNFHHQQSMRIRHIETSWQYATRRFLPSP